MLYSWVVSEAADGFEVPVFMVSGYLFELSGCPIYDKLSCFMFFVCLVVYTDFPLDYAYSYIFCDPF